MTMTPARSSPFAAMARDRPLKIVGTSVAFRMIRFCIA